MIKELLEEAKNLHLKYQTKGVFTQDIDDLTQRIDKTLNSYFEIHKGPSEEDAFVPQLAEINYILKEDRIGRNPGYHLQPNSDRIWIKFSESKNEEGVPLITGVVELKPQNI